MNPLDRSSQVHFMAEVQNFLDFPPAPVWASTASSIRRSLPRTRRRCRGKSSSSARPSARPAIRPRIYTDNSMHNLQVERFYKTQEINGMVATSQGPIKTFALRGIKESPPYFHDGRLLTLEDSVEFFNLVLETQLNTEEKRDLVAFMRQL